MKALDVVLPNHELAILPQVKDMAECSVCLEMYQDHQHYHQHHPHQGWAPELVREVDGGKALLGRLQPQFPHLFAFLVLKHSSVGR